MAKYEPKTKPNDASVEKYLAAIGDETRRKDCATLMRLMKRVTKSEPRMWGTSIVGYGQYHYASKGGSEGDWPLVGFASRKQDLTLYVMDGADRYPKQLAKLGKHKLGKSCLYLKGLENVDLAALEDLLAHSVKNMRERTACS